MSELEEPATDPYIGQDETGESGSSDNEEEHEASSQDQLEGENEVPVDEQTKANSPCKKRGLDEEEDEAPSLKRFRITPKEEEFKWELPVDMLQYWKDNVEKFIPDKDIMEGILQTEPVPSNVPKVRKLDEFISPFLTKYAEKLDTSFEKIEEKLTNVMGPLSKVWKTLEDFNDDTTNECSINLEDLLPNVQKSIILLGQTLNATTYQRRLYALSAVCKDSAKAKTHLKEKAELFKGQSDLFGAKFRKNLTELTKEREKSRNLMKVLGSRKENVSTGAGVYQQPFQRRPFHGKDSRKSGNGPYRKTLHVQKGQGSHRGRGNYGNFNRRHNGGNGGNGGGQSTSNV